MNREVIGMPVTPTGVVTGHYIGVLVIEDLGDLASNDGGVHVRKSVVLRV